MLTVAEFLDCSRDALALIGLVDADELHQHLEFLRRFMARNPAVRELLRVDRGGPIGVRHPGSNRAG